jgi:hypothetical protein
VQYRKLVGILDSAQAKLDRGQLAKARIKICQFVEELENAVSRNRLSISDANRLIKDASIVLAQIKFE